jgi:hypothetical protein
MIRPKEAAAAPPAKPTDPAAALRQAANLAEIAYRGLVELSYDQPAWEIITGAAKVAALIDASGQLRHAVRELRLIADALPAPAPPAATTLGDRVAERIAAALRAAPFRCGHCGADVADPETHTCETPA